MNQKLKRYFYHYRKEIGIGTICFFICLISIICLLPKSKAQSPSQTREPLELEVEKNIETEEVIRVDIKGAVTNPGVYEMRSTARVNDVIYQAGGILENADLSRINLSKHVTDEMVIIIYTKEEMDTYNNPPTKIEYVYIEPNCSCPDAINDACIIPKEENETKISLNHATKEQLEILPGIGKSKADAIISYRETKPFESIEELKEIKGIGEAIFEKLKDYIML